MSAFPKLRIDLGVIADNTAKVLRLCAQHGVDVACVTKGVCANTGVAGAMLDGGCRAFADSRLRNLVRLKEAFPSVPRLLLRLPMRSEIRDVPLYAECSMVSTPESVDALDARCRVIRRRHEVIVMFDMGDRREGLVGEEGIAEFARAFQRASWVAPRGVGTNFGCFAGVRPSLEALRRLSHARGVLAEQSGISVPVCSGGSTSSLILLEREQGHVTEGTPFNHLRVGEAILLGLDVTWGRAIPWLDGGAFRMEAEVVESMVKPSLPEGEEGADAFGVERTFEDDGEQRRAILAVGRQDVPVENLVPLDEGVRVIGGSSDHMIVASEREIGWGTTLSFGMDYAALLRLATSPYVSKEYE
ncbi:MAG: alanine racemase [Synergistaceae bacterium]|jgi:predicted amino acid racemase|nr:alanine racemase [Synergistaceae bacterium]